MEQRSQDWYAARLGKVTASVAAACLGLDPGKSRQEAWRAILGIDVQRDNPYMRWGRTHEKQARNHYEAVRGVFADDAGFLLHPRHPWLGCSPDGLVEAEGMVEVKCPPTLPATVSVPHRIQMLVQLAVTGRAWCDYFAWTPDDHFLERVFPVRGDGLIRALKRFHETYVESMIPPPRKKRRRKRGANA